MRRRLETSRQFLNLFATANGRPVDGRQAVGRAEQVATVHLIADFACSDKLLRNATLEGLKDLGAWDKDSSGESELAVASAAREALKRMPRN
jgi:hypothetical protein